MPAGVGAAPSTPAPSGAASPAPAASAAAPAVAPPSGPRQVPSYRIQQFLATEVLSGLSFSPDNSKILVSSDRSGIFNAYAIPLAGGEPQQLTLSTTDAIRVDSYLPNDERFLFTSDHAGDERAHVYLRDRDGVAKDLTPGEGITASFLGWAPDQTSFYVLTNERDRRFFDVYEYSGAGRSRILQDEVGYSDPVVAPSRRYVAVTREASWLDSDVWIVDRQDGRVRNLTGHTGAQRNHAAAWSPDSASLYFTSDRDGEFLGLYRIDVASGRVEPVLRPTWDVVDARLARDGRHLLVTVDVDASHELHLLDAASGAEIPLPGLPAGYVSGAETSRDGTLLGLYVESSRSPRNLYLYDLARHQARALTRTLPANLDPNDLVEGETVRFASYDGVEIPGILYRPAAAAPGAPVPALVWVHGGPGDQSMRRWSAPIQYLANHGYAVYAINNRGSSGYGKTFYALDDRKHGSADLDDCVAARGMLTATGWVDPAKIGILGGSYGGYMVLAALAFRPEAFAVGVDLFGISNWTRTLESIPAWWESMRQSLYREMGDPKVDRAALEAASPILHADAIRKPLLVLQGANDPRVLQAESDEIVAAVKARGVPVEYVVFPDEGHGFVKKANQERGYGAILEFLDRYLRGE